MSEAASLAGRAEALAADGHLHAAGGWGAYAVAAAALTAGPRDLATLALFRRLVAAAGLSTPTIPFDLVAAPACDPAAVESLLAELVRLRAAGLVKAVAITCVPADTDALVELIESRLDGLDLELDLIPAATMVPLLRHGRALLAPFGSPHVRLAESLGVPALQYDFPDPVARPLDLDLWQAPRPERSLR